MGLRPRRFPLRAGGHPLLAFLCAALFALQLGLALPDLPSTRLMQDIICRLALERQQQRGAQPSPPPLLIPEEQCHGRDVQRELNLVCVGISISLTICAAISAIPLCLASDTIGRLPVLLISALSLLASQLYATLVVALPRPGGAVPLRAVWAMGAPLALGGGRGIAEAMVFAMISDSVPEHKRALWFQCIVGSVVAAQALSPVLAARLMAASIRTPLWTSLALILAAGIALALFTPETRPRSSSAGIPLGTPDSSSTSSGTTLRPPSFRQTLSLALRSLRSKPAIYLVPATTLALPLAGTQGATLFRLMPVRFSWSLQSSSLLLAAQSAVTFAVLVVVLPAAAHALGNAPSLSATSSSSSAAATRDRILLRASVSFLALGPALMAMISSPAFLATGAIVSAWGSGVPTLARALLITALPGPEHVGSVFGILAVGEILGTLACDIISGALFDLGLRTWIGLPFIFAVVTSALILLTAWQVPGPNHSPEVDATLEESKDQ